MWYFRALNRRCTYWLARQLPPGPAKVLDAGCGTGGLINTFKTFNPAWDCVGLDYMPVACELARERTGAMIVEGSILCLPFPDASFDAVVALDVICQVNDAAQAMREIVRVTRPGGVVLINVPALMWLWSYHDDACHTKHRYTRPELVALGQAAGLRVDFASYANMLTLPLILGWRKFFRRSQETSDVRNYSFVLDRLAATLAWLEYAWQCAGLSSALGSSVFFTGSRSARPRL